MVGPLIWNDECCISSRRATVKQSLKSKLHYISRLKYQMQPFKSIKCIHIHFYLCTSRMAEIRYLKSREWCCTDWRADKRSKWVRAWIGYSMQLFWRITVSFQTIRQVVVNLKWISCTVSNECTRQFCNIICMFVKQIFFGQNQRECMPVLLILVSLTYSVKLKWLCLLLVDISLSGLGGC